MTLEDNREAQEPLGRVPRGVPEALRTVGITSEFRMIIILCRYDQLGEPICVIRRLACGEMRCRAHCVHAPLCVPDNCTSRQSRLGRHQNANSKENLDEIDLY